MMYLKSTVALYELNKSAAIYINMEKNKVTKTDEVHKLLARLVAVYLYT